jgi:hypothetical protein
MRLIYQTPFYYLAKWSFFMEAADDSKSHIEKELSIKNKSGCCQLILNNKIKASYRVFVSLPKNQA